MDFTTIPLGIGLVFAFFGGLASFVSPCVLPLVPAYIGYMGGRVTHTVSVQVSGGAATGVARASRWNTFLNGIAFVAGFTFVFVIFGLLTTALVRSVSGSHVGALEGVIGRVGGVIIIFFGLHFMGALPRLFKFLRAHPAALSNPLFSIVAALIGTALLWWGFSGVLLPDSMRWELWRTTGTLWVPILGAVAALLLLLALFLGGAFTQPAVFWTKAMNTVEYTLYTDTRWQLEANGQQGFLGSAMMGVIFSAGWTPCIGPIYGSILMASASLTRSVGESALWLAAYCLGLGVPFLLMALMLDGAQGVLRRLQRHMQKIEVVTGLFLIFIGFMVASGQLQSLSQQFAGEFGDFSIAVETWVQEQIERIFGLQSSENSDAGSSLVPSGVLVWAQDGFLAAASPFSFISQPPAYAA